MAFSLRSRLYALLRKAERYVQADLVYLAKGGFWLTAAQGITSLSSLLLSIAFANLLDQNTYGLYRYTLTAAGLISIFGLTGLTTAVTQSVAQGKDGVLVPTVRTKMKWATLGGIVALACALYYYVQGNSPLAICFLIMAVFAPFMDPAGLYDAFLQGKKNFKASALYMASAQITAAIAMGAALVLTDNLYVIVFSYFAAWTCMRYLLLGITIRKYRPALASASETIRYGKHVSALNAASVIAGYLDKLLVFHFLGAANLAIYAIALAPADQLKSAFKNIPALALPILSRKPVQEIDSLLYRRIFQLLLLGGFFAILYIVIAPFAFPLLFPKYLSSIAYSQWYMVSIAFVPALSFFSTVSISKPSLLNLSYTITLAGNLFLIAAMLVLGYRYGIAGIIAARILQSFFALAMLSYLWQRERKRGSFSNAKH